MNFIMVSGSGQVTAMSIGLCGPKFVAELSLLA